jgi:hypothetical protein
VVGDVSYRWIVEKEDVRRGAGVVEVRRCHGGAVGEVRGSRRCLRGGRTGGGEWGRGSMPSTGVGGGGRDRHRAGVTAGVARLPLGAGEDGAGITTGMLGAEASRAKAARVVKMGRAGRGTRSVDADLTNLIE